MPSVENWNGTEIDVATTSGGTLLVCNPFDALMRPIAGPWPSPALVMQLGEGEPGRYPFTEELRAQVSTPLGHYCEMQSLNSEDAITWSFFGTLMAGPADRRAHFLNWLCDRLGMPWIANTCGAIDLWRRIPHPYYPGTDGPELDAVLDGDDCVAFVEAKWLSKEGTGRGPDGGRVGQMHLRQRFFERWGNALYGDRGKLVLSVGLAGNLVPDQAPDEHGIAVRSMTWTALADYPAHPNGDEFARYLAWKLKHSPLAATRLRAAKAGLSGTSAPIAT
jgi:hypothetical protein